MAQKAVQFRRRNQSNGDGIRLPVVTAIGIVVLIAVLVAGCSSPIKKVATRSAVSTTCAQCDSLSQSQKNSIQRGTAANLEVLDFTPSTAKYVDWLTYLDTACELAANVGSTLETVVSDSGNPSCADFMNATALAREKWIVALAQSINQSAYESNVSDTQVAAVVAQCTPDTPLAVAMQDAITASPPAVAVHGPAIDVLNPEGYKAVVTVNSWTVESEIDPACPLPSGLSGEAGESLVVEATATFPESNGFYWTGLFQQVTFGPTTPQADELAMAQTARFYVCAGSTASGPDLGHSGTWQVNVTDHQPAQVRAVITFFSPKTPNHPNGDFADITWAEVGMGVDNSAGRSCLDANANGFQAEDSVGGCSVTSAHPGS